MTKDLENRNILLIFVLLINQNIIVMNIRFIEVTNNYNLKKTKMVLSVNGIKGIYAHENGISTTLKHDSHNNCGYEVAESVEQILKLIKESKAI